MSQHIGTTDHTTSRNNEDQSYTRRVSTETKSAFKTTEMFAYVAAVIGVLVAAAFTDVSDFGPQEAWFYVTLLTIGYMVSRGLSKSGSRDPYDDHVQGR